MITEGKILWLGYVARLSNNRCTSRTTEWYSEKRRPLSRPSSIRGAYLEELWIITENKWFRIAFEIALLGVWLRFHDTESFSCGPERFWWIQSNITNDMSFFRHNLYPFLSTLLTPLYQFLHAIREKLFLVVPWARSALFFFFFGCVTSKLLLAITPKFFS